MNLTSKALLTQIQISMWMGRKMDKAASREMTDAKHATRGVARVHKDLLPGDTHLEVVHSLAGAIRGYYYENTLPWGMDGSKLLPSSNYLSFMPTFRTKVSDWDYRVREFCDSYRAEYGRRRTMLGNLYNPQDYPHPDEMRAKFKIDLAVFPVPANDFRVSISSDELARIQQDVEKRMKDASKVAMQDVWQRLYERVKKIADKCADPKAIFRDTLMENAREICDLLPRLNLTDDPDLERMRQEVESKLIMHPEMLRNDPDKRRATAIEAQKIMDVMGTFMGVK